MLIHGSPVEVFRGHPRKSLSDRYELRVERREGCWGWSGFISTGGYGWIKAGGGSSPSIGAHCAAWIIRRGLIPDGMQVNHVCDNPPCTRNDDDEVYVVNGVEYERVGHLWLGTGHANSLDMVQKGRKYPSGPPRRLRKLTDDDVRTIRIRYAVGNIAMRMLGHEYGVTTECIYAVVHRKTWVHVL